MRIFEIWFRQNGRGLRKEVEESGVAYMTAGESHALVEKGKEAYTAKLVHQDTLAKFNATIILSPLTVLSFSTHH